MDDGPISLLEDKELFQRIKAVLTSAKGILWITTGANASSGHPGAALTNGLLRTLRIEYPGKQYISLDLDHNGDSLIDIRDGNTEHYQDSGSSVLNPTTALRLVASSNHSLRMGAVSRSLVCRFRSQSSRLWTAIATQLTITRCVSQPHFRPRFPPRYVA